MESVDQAARLRTGLFRRLPIVLQTEAAECGLACLSMILGYFDQSEHLSELRRRFGFSQKGATLKDLMEVAERLGARTRAVRVELDDLNQLQRPCILHWDLSHFVVLRSLNRSRAVIHDPAVGVRRLRLAEVSRHFTGVALEVFPSPAVGISQRPKRSLGLHTLFGSVIGLGGALTRVLLLALAIELFAILSPFFLQWTIDHALVTADRGLLITLVIGFAMLLLLRVAVSTMRAWSLMAIQASLRVQAQGNLFRHLVHLPASFFDSRNLGDILSRFGSQDEVLNAITSDVLEALMDGLLVVVTITIMFLYSPFLALVVLGGTLAYAILRWSLYSPLRNAVAEEVVWCARKDNHLLETIRGIRAIKLMNGIEDRGLQWSNYVVESTNRRLAIEKLSIAFRASNFLLTGAVTILVVWLGAKATLAGTLTVGMLIAFLAYKDQFVQRISNLIDRAVELRMLRVHAERVADIALTAPEELRPPRSHAIRLREPSIEVRNLRYRYSEHEPYILDGVSFRVAAGECVAVIGVSGCGKTTLLKLLASLLQPIEGEILIGDQPIAAYGIQNYRSIVGAVMQDDQMFAGSIAENICFFSRDPDYSRIETVARIASVHDEVMAMPMGYSTLIGDMGTVLSGGQKQRVLLARALYREPSILLLDEATSHLDVAREKAVNTAIRELQITRVLVAHRPETIKSADRVIVLDKGGVAKDLKVFGEGQENRWLSALLGS